MHLPRTVVRSNQGILARTAPQQFLRELALVVAGGLVYFLIRGGVVDRAAEARDRALDLMALERSLGLFWEQTMQGWILPSRTLIDLFNGIYFWTHMPVIVVTALLLFWRRRPLYGLIRNAFLVSAVIALGMYYVLPVAPPRLFPGLGFIDTMALYSPANYQASEVGPFVNPFAALPSLHVGWALLLGVGIWLARPQRLAARRAAVVLAVLLPLSQTVAVVVTANHYLLDVVAVVVVAALALGVAIAWQRWRSGRWWGRQRGLS